MPKIKNKQIPPDCLPTTTNTSLFITIDIYEVADGWGYKLFCKIPLACSARILNGESH